MSHQVSIIINANNGEQKYLIRCINSIQRQRYENKESIVWAEDNVLDAEMEVNVPVMNTEKLWDYISKSESEWIVFCNSNSVLAPNVLESLMNKSAAENCMSAVKYMLKKNDKFVEEDSIWVKFSPYGKLFNKRKVLSLPYKKEIKIDVLFTLQYLDYCRVELEKADSYIYDSTGETVKVAIDEISDFAYKLRTDYRNRFDLNVGFAESCLDCLLKKAIEQHESEYYQFTQQYINAIADEDEELLPFILDAVHISPAQYQYVRNGSLDEFIFYKNRVDMLKQNQSVGRDVKSLDGYNLAQTTVALYRDGRLGLQTILASLAGWIEFKIKGKEVW